MASQGTTLTQSGQQVQELLNKIDALAPATQEQAGTMSAEDKAKLDGVAAGADVSVNPDWEASSGKAEILNKPTIPTRIAQLDDDGLHRTVTDDEKANWNSKTSFSGNYNDLTNKPDLSQFITKTVNDLVYYYTKSETYTKTQVDNLINAIQTMHYEVYPILPETGAGNVLYLIGPIGTGADKYEEYVYYNNQWKKIGETSIDLSGYVTTTALNTALANYTTTANLTTLLAGKQDVISDLSTIRTGASKGNTAYQKPSGGIPKSDLASGVQDSLDLADSSLQYTPSGVVNPSVTPAEYATRDELEELELEVDEKADKGDFSYDDVHKGASEFSSANGFFATNKTKESDFSSNNSFLNHIFTGLAPGTKIHYNVRVNSNCNRFTAINASGDIIDHDVASNGNVFETGVYTVPANTVKVYLTVRNDVSFVADQTYWFEYDLKNDVDETVRFTEQTLTNPQKTQARANIGAIGEGEDIYYKDTKGGADFFTGSGYLGKDDTNVSDMHSGSVWHWARVNVSPGDKFDYGLDGGAAVMIIAAIGAEGAIIDDILGNSEDALIEGTYTVPENTEYVIVTTHENSLSTSYIRNYVYVAEEMSKTVKFTEQTLTALQKKQARDNIGAFGEGDSLFVKVRNGGATYFTKNGYLAKTDTNVSQMHTGSSWFWKKLNVKSGDKFDYGLSAGGSVMMVAAVGAGGTILDYVVGAGAGTMSYGTYTVPANTVYVLVTTYETKLSDSYIDEYVYLDELAKDLGGGGGIIERNGVVETTNKLMQGKRGLGNSAVKQVSLLQFSDIHANEAALKNVVDFFNYYGEYIDSVIHCGDSVQTYYSTSDDFAFWASAGAGAFLNTIGNHDSATYNGSYDWDGVSEADCYARFFADFIADWGVTYTADKCYYYKDYTGANLRVIVLDEMHYGQTQHDWFEATLASAKTAGYDVLCVIHSTVLGIVTKVSTFASSEKTSTGIGTLTPSPLDAVDSFISDGGHFACWLDGHTHFDDCGYVNGHPNQLHICVTTQNYLQAGGGDTDRTVGEKQQDAFNIVCVDSATHKLRVFRIGADFDRLLRHKGVMCYDYENHQLIFNG